MVLEGKNSWVTIHTWANGICYASSNYFTFYFHKGLCQFCKKIHNDMKFYLFTLMGFDDHCMGVSLAWIITSKQTVEDLIEWLKSLKEKMLSHMPRWKPSCFLIDDAPQELKALRLVIYLVLTLCLFP